MKKILEIKILANTVLTKIFSKECSKLNEICFDSVNMHRSGRFSEPANAMQLYTKFTLKRILIYAMHILHAMTLV